MFSLRSVRFSLPAGILLAFVAALTVHFVATPQPASANLELVGALCNGVFPGVEAPGQLGGDGIPQGGDGQSDTRARFGRPGSSCPLISSRVMARKLTPRFKLTLTQRFPVRSGGTLA